MTNWKLLLSIGLTALMAACDSGQPMVRDPKVMLAYEMDPSTDNMVNLSKAYSTTINKIRKTGERYPGLYSDYAVTLALQGKASEANVWFNNEMEAFPSSKKYVMQLKKQMIPQFLNDTTHFLDMDIEEDTTPTESDEFGDTRRAAAVDRAATVMQPVNDSIDNAVDESDSTEEPEQEN